MSRLTNELLDEAISNLTEDVRGLKKNDTYDMLTTATACLIFLEELKAYRDAEEQGLLLRLPKGIEDIDKRVIEYSLIKAINLSRYGVDVDGKLKNATETAWALNQAYMRGRQDERDRFHELKEEAEKKLASMQKGE